MTTKNLAFTEMVSSQFQKELTFNDALWLLDAVLGSGITNRTTSTPPVSPAEGDCYIVGATATGDWTGQENSIAQFVNATWRFYAPKEGWHVYLTDENQFVIYDGTKWTIQESIAYGTETDTFKQVLNIVRNNAAVGWIDQSGTDIRVKSASGNDAKLINNGNKGFSAQDGGNQVIDVTSAAVPAGDLSNGQISFSLDETGNFLNVYVKYSGGTTKTGTLALV